MLANPEPAGLLMVQEIVEAAHIVPWSRSKNDDIRNGMALCKLCHWGFD